MGGNLVTADTLSDLIALCEIMQRYHMIKNYNDQYKSNFNQDRNEIESYILNDRHYV